MSAVSEYVCISDLKEFFFCKQKTAYELRISDWSSDVCSSDLALAGVRARELFAIPQGALNLGAAVPHIAIGHAIEQARIDGKTTGRACRICPAKHTASRSPAAQGKRLRLIAFRGGVPVQCQDEGGCVSIGSDHLRRPEMLPSHDRSDGCSTEPFKCPSRQERRFGRIDRKAFCMGRRKTGDKAYPRLSLCAPLTKR